MGLNDIVDRWAQLDDLFHQAVTLPPDEVEAFCRSACGDDEELRAFLVELVTSAEFGDDRIRNSIAALAQDVANEDLLTGERVGAYHIDALLARGGMGDVYVGSRADGAFEKKVAIKLIRSKLNQEEFVQHFKAERQVLASLSHASIPALIDAGQLADGRPYFVGEYIEGLPIDQYCDANKLTRVERLLLLERVAEAVQYAHNNLVLHLDIKPDNILVQEDGTPCLLDFGIARLMGDRDVGHQAFTPEYASPEQIRGDTPSAASDVYALGVLLYRILTGKAPFAAPRFAPAETKIADRQTFDDATAHPLALSELNRDLQAIVRKATAQDRSARYASIEALSRDLENYRQKRPLTARTSTLPYRASMYIKRHPLAIASVIAIFAVLTGFAIREANLRQEAQTAYLLAEQEAETARQVSTFLTELFEVSDPGEARGNSVTARELLDTGAARILDNLNDQPLVQSRLMRVMGGVYSQLGLNAEAKPLLENALAVRDAAVQGGDAELGLLLTNLGIVYMRQGNLGDAEDVLNRSLDIRQREFGSHHETVAHSLTFIGVLKTLQNEYKEAEANLLRAISIYEELHGPEYPALSESVGDLATVYYRMGQTDKSIQLHKRAIAIVENAEGPDHPTVAMRLDNLGNTYQSAGRNQEALVLVERALKIREKVLSPKHPLVANNLDNLGNVYVALEDYDRAESLKLRALAIREEVLGPTHPHVATSLGNLGALYMEQDQLEKAQDYLFRSIDIKAQVYEPDSPRVAIGKLNLGNVYFKQGDFDNAFAETSDAIAILQQRLPDDHLYRMYADWQLAKIYNATDRIDEARNLYEAVLPLWQARHEEDPDRAKMLEDYESFVLQRGGDQGDE